MDVTHFSFPFNGGKHVSLEQYINHCLLFLTIKILLANYFCRNINKEKKSVQLV